MSTDSNDPIEAPGDVIVVECGSGGLQVAVFSHWLDDRRFVARKYLATSRRWSSLLTLHVQSIVGPVETHAKRGRIRAALAAARKLGFPAEK